MSKLTDEQIEEFLECFFFAYYHKAKAAGTWMPFAGTHAAITKKVKDFFFGYGELTTKELGSMIGSLGQNPKEVGQLTEVQIKELKAIIDYDTGNVSCTITVKDLGLVMKTLGGSAPEDDKKDDDKVPGENLVEMRARKAAEQRLVDEATEQRVTTRYVYEGANCKELFEELIGADNGNEYVYEHEILAQTDKKGEDLVRVLYSIMVAYSVYVSLMFSESYDLNYSCESYDL